LIRGGDFWKAGKKSSNHTSLKLSLQPMNSSAVEHEIEKVEKGGGVS